jgi:hemoglobin
MVRAHLERHLTEAQRRRWFDLLLDTANEVGLPDDPEFRSALVGYLEWGSRLALLNSQPGVAVDENAAMPRWGWGEVRGPYTPSGT